jgi:hypothetical protein
MDLLYIFPKKKIGKKIGFFLFIYLFLFIFPTLFIFSLKSMMVL